MDMTDRILLAITIICIWGYIGYLTYEINGIKAILAENPVIECQDSKTNQ